jgi:septum formation protein
MSRFSFIYLASQSPRRQQLLEQIGVRFELLPADPDEDADALEAERPGELPLAYVERVARAKLDAARARLQRRKLPAAPILCADTAVALGKRIFGKPVDAADAARTLKQLSGAMHRVHSGVALSDDDKTRFALNTSEVHFTTLDKSEIDRYVATGDAFGKAGAYAIQSSAAAWVRHIEGSYSGIMGLPLFETAQLLRRVDVSFSGNA